MKSAYLALVLLLAAPAAAAEPIAPAADATTMAAANRVLEAMGYESLMSRITEEMSGHFETETKRIVEDQTGKPADPEMLRRLAAAQKEFMRTFVTDPKLRQATVLLYASHFSATELDRVAELLRDPAMRKWNDKTPLLMAEFMPLVTSQLNARRDSFQEEIVSIMLEYLGKDEQGETTQ